LRTQTRRKHVKTLANKAEYEQFLAQNSFALVDFSATWCGPCRILAPILEELSKTESGLAIATIDVDNNTELTAQFVIQSVPSMLLFRSGTLVSRKIGVQSIDKIRVWLKETPCEVL
jgi:thioredoxin 1